jgi:hypothetical protein
MAYERARGRCQLDAHLHCCGGMALPWEGGIRERGHLVHLRNKRMYGWGPENVAWGCPHGHLDLCHTKGLLLPRTYSELVGRPADGIVGETLELLRERGSIDAD